MMISPDLLRSLVLPPHRGSGAFDHAAVRTASGHVFVAHTANDAVDVIDPVAGRLLWSVPDLLGVAGVLVSDESNLVITSNRAENTIGLFDPDRPSAVRKIAVGIHPNGLAYDSARGLILAANVGDPAIANSCTLSMVDVEAGRVHAEIPVPSRTRWAIYEPDSQSFFVNIDEPAMIAVVEARRPDRIAREIPVPAAGPHGLDLDFATRRLFCACDAALLVTLDAGTGRVLAELPLSGTPDVVFLDSRRQRLYAAVGDPGVIDVIDTAQMERLGSFATERGAHTFALAADCSELYAFLPASHRLAVFRI